MQEIDQRDRELLGALQGEIPLVSTPFAFIGQTLDMSEKEVIKRTERLKRDGVIRQLAAQFDARALGYRTCLVAARVDPERIDEAAAAINAHPGVTQNYRRNNDLNLWFTLFVSPQSKLGLDRTIEILGRQRGVRQRPPAADAQAVQEQRRGRRRLISEHETHGDYTPLTPLEVECVRLLQRDLPLQPRPFDSSRAPPASAPTSCSTAARTLQKRGQIRRFAATVTPRKTGLRRQRDGRLGRAAGSAPTNTPRSSSQHRAVSHCYLRPVYDDWPYNLYTTVHARSVDECESVINDLAIDSGLRRSRRSIRRRSTRRRASASSRARRRSGKRAHATRPGAWPRVSSREKRLLARVARRAHCI